MALPSARRYSRLMVPSLDVCSRATESEPSVAHDPRAARAAAGTFRMSSRPRAPFAYSHSQTCAPRYRGCPSPASSVPSSSRVRLYKLRSGPAAINPGCNTGSPLATRVELPDISVLDRGLLLRDLAADPRGIGRRASVLSVAMVVVTQRHLVLWLAGAAGAAGVVNILLPGPCVHVFFPNSTTRCEIGSAQTRMAVRIVGEHSLSLAIVLYTLSGRTAEPAIRHAIAATSLCSCAVLLTNIFGVDAQTAGMRRANVLPWLFVQALVGAYFMLV
eukprot:m.44787 g.44787  ORF g.44787 m.44787 type:complete len:274 (-) comp5843_c0_seq1:104-925(-)